MNDTEASTPAELGDYDLEVTTFQTFCLDPEVGDILQNFSKRIEARIMMSPTDGSPPEAVGTAQGMFFLGGRAAEEGISLRHLLDDHDAGLLEMFDVFSVGVVLPEEDILYVSDITIEPGHELSGMRRALVEQLVQTAGSSVRLAFTWFDDFNLSDLPAEEQLVRLPKDSLRIEEPGMVLVGGTTLLHEQYEADDLRGWLADGAE